MKKTSPLLALLVVIGLATPAAAGTQVTGVIEVGNPMSKAIGGLTENLGGCDPDSEVQGLDGWWIALGASAGGSPATLTSAGVDTDVWFFDAACGLIGTDDDAAAYDMATDLSSDEAGTIPSAAAFAVVDLAAGANASFTFTVG